MYWELSYPLRYKRTSATPVGQAWKHFSKNQEIGSIWPFASVIMKGALHLLSYFKTLSVSPVGVELTKINTFWDQRKWKQK